MDNERGTQSEKVEKETSTASMNSVEGSRDLVNDKSETLSSGNDKKESYADKKATAKTELANPTVDPENEESVSPDLIVPEGETKKQRIKRRLKLLLKLFLCYLKIGLFTFGGGYAMIALIENEYVRKRRWITNEEFYEIIAIAESTGFWGALVAVIGVCIPSLVVIYVISIFYDEFMAFTPVQYAFEGIKVGIAILITSAGIGMMKKARKDVFDWCVFVPALLLVTLFDIFNIDFSSIYLILIGIAIGIIYKLIIDGINKKKGGFGTAAPAGDLQPKTDDGQEEELL